MLHFKRFFFFLIPVLFLGCKEKKTTTTVTVSQEDIQLLAYPYNYSSLSIKLSDVALLRSTYKETKDIANEVLKINKDLKNEWEVIAAKKSLQLPLDITADQLNLWQKLVSKKGAEFDQAYIQMVMNNDSLKNIALTQVANNASDKDIRETGLDILNRSKAHPLATRIKQLLKDNAETDSLLLQVANQ